MSHIRSPRAIIDRRALVVSLEAIISLEPSPKALREALLVALRGAYQAGYAAIRERFFEGRPNGAVTVREMCYLTDQVVITLYDFATQHVFARSSLTKGEHLSLLAVGGYGRGELSPKSDLDLLFLLPYKTTPRSEQVVEFMLYILWDLGLKVGHATRSIDECLRLARQDITIRTALLEARWLWGDRALADDLQARFRPEVVSGTGSDFVQKKLAERDARHDRLGDSRYLLEPNVKEDKGGLRDLHTLFWIAKYLYRIQDVRELVDLGIVNDQAADRFLKSQTFLWTVRCALHYLTNRAEDRLTFDMQKEIASRLGYTDHTGAAGVERFMKHYFLTAKDVGDLTRIFCSVLEETNKRPPKFLARKSRKLGEFVIESERLALPAGKSFAQEPLLLLKLFRASQSENLDIHPNTLRLVTESLKYVASLRNNPEANALFLDMLTDPVHGPENILRRLNETGVFGRFIPDFGTVVAQMQYDMYHVYTTDEHTIRAVGLLHRIETGLLVSELPLSSEVISTIHSRRALYVAVMLHDIAKGRGGDHSVLGGEVAEKLCPRLGLTPEETETVAWLVQQHLAMSRVAFKFDIDDQQTIDSFARLVQSPERLKLLLVLTCADIRAVGPQVWNGWKASLLRELYYRTEDTLSGSLAAEARDTRVQRQKAALSQALTDWGAEDVDNFLSLGYPGYWLAYDTATQVRHATIVRQAARDQAALVVEVTPYGANDVAEVMIYTPDHAGLFAMLTGAIALQGCSIVDARVITLANGMALDTFTVYDSKGELPVSVVKQERLRKSIIEAVTGRIHLDRDMAAMRGTLPSRAKVFTVPPRVIVDNIASKTHTVVEVNGRDRPGFLYDVTRTLTQLGFQIGSARISTYGERVVDVFYLKDIFGMKIDHPSKLKSLREGLIEVLEKRDRQPAPLKRQVG